MPVYTGGAGNDSLVAGGGQIDDTLDGGLGADTMQGGDGSDFYVVDNAGDVVQEFFADALAGNDTVQATVNYTLTFGVENLLLAGLVGLTGTGNALANHIRGTGGNDLLQGLDGNDTLDGAFGFDTLDGGNGVDTADFRFFNGRLSVDLAAGTAGFPDNSPTLESLISIENVLAGNANDTLLGNALNNALDGGGGNDSLNGGNGDDALSGGEGNDTLDGNFGFDTLDGGNGVDTVDYRFFTGRLSVDLAAGTAGFPDNSATLESLIGIENVLAGNANDTLLGSTADNTLDGGGGADVLTGGDGNDTLVGGTGNDALTGGNGIDTADYRTATGALVVNLAAGSAVIDGDANQTDTLATLENVLGGSGNDSLLGNAGDNLLGGGDGNDTLDGGFGFDTLDGGNGVDTADYRFFNGTLGVDLGGGTAAFPENSATLESLIGIENVLAGGGNDSLLGSAADNTLDGGGGNDTLDGGTGNDSLVGGAGNNELAGGDGNDTFVGAAGSIDAMSGGAGTDGFNLNAVSDLAGWTLNGGDGVDTADLIESNLQLGTTLPFVLVEQLDTLGTVFLGTGGADSYDFSPIATIAFGAAYQLVLTAGDGNDTVIGTNAAWAGGLHFISGDGGNDSIVGGTARDSLLGGEGDDSLHGGAGSSADQLFGGNGNDTLYGGGGTDSVDAGAGDDSVIAALGIDVADGGDGVDTIDTSLFNGAYAVNLVTGATNFVGESYTHFEHLRTGNGNDTLTGSDAANRIEAGGGADNILGAGGDDTLDGGAGADTLDGGLGADTYYIDDVGDVVSDSGGETGVVDTLYASVDVATVDGIENFVLGAAAIAVAGNSAANRIEGQGTANLLDGSFGDDTLLGQGGNDTLRGGDGNDVLDGGSGADSMDGGDGNDVYLVDESLDMVYEGFNDPAGGLDTVRSSVSYTIGDLPAQRGYGIEEIELLGSDDIDATGNSNGNRIAGNVGANELRGGAGGDLLDGGDGADTLSGGSGDDALNGGLGVDVLAGGTGNDTLDGGDGADVLAGGDGNDLYRVGSTLDTLHEAAGGGQDRVVAAVSWTLGGEFEELVLDGTGNLNGTGNAAANLLLGNAGNNRLDGGLGADTLRGGDGGDTYVVNEAGDTVDETASDPLQVDGVVAAISWTLGANLENLLLSGTLASSGTGNALKNLLTGNAAANTLTGLGGNDTLDGGGGADSMVGGTGNDTYVVNVATDKTIETGTSAAEIDLVRAGLSWTLGVNLEQLLLTGTLAINGTGNTLNNLITGNEAANTLAGGTGRDTLNGAGGNDVLDGGIGNDSLIGGLGNDTFRFAATLSATTNVDVVSGFSHTADRFLLEDAVFAGIGPVGALAAGAFRIGTGALDADDRIIYNKAQGKLYFDKDGFGGTGPVLFATVGANADVRADDFFVS